MPVKRSINLILVDENKISLTKAVPAIILIVALAFAFSKYMVADRLIEMSRASGQASSLKTTLDQATQSLQDYEGIEDTYAHMTYAGMTQEELDRVDRVRILELVSTILPQGEYTRSWSVAGNVLTVEITGRSLEYLNELARRIEESPIVDSCAITTAVKNEKEQNTLNTNNSTASQSLVGALESRRREVESGLVDNMLSAMSRVLNPEQSQNVQARLTIYLMKPVETEEPEATAAPEGSEATGAIGGGESPEGMSIETTAKKPARPAAPERPATEADQAVEATQQPAAEAGTDAAAQATAETAQPTGEDAAAQAAQPADDAAPAASEPEEVSAP